MSAPNGHIDSDLERRPARSPADTAWAHARVERAKGIWQHAALQYGEAWARGLRLLYSEADPVPRLVHAEAGAALTELRQWVALHAGDARG